MEKGKEIAKFEDLNKRVENKFVQLVKSEEYPLEVREGVNEVMNIISQEKSITDLYPEELAEIPISQSHFQDQCVQYSQHYTPHKKLRQALMEMQDRINALYAAKTGQKKAVLKVERIKFEIENLENELLNAETEYEKRRWMLSIAEKEVDLEEAERGLKDASHLIKDAMLKVVHQKKLVERYRKQVEESGLSYEESEVIYYVMYFTKEACVQILSGDFNVDRGTYGAISQLPKPIRMKILNNISFMKHKVREEGWSQDQDYLFKVYWDKLVPKKTGPGEFEGMKLTEHLSFNPVKLLSDDIEMNIYEDQEKD